MAGISLQQVTSHLLWFPPQLTTPLTVSSEEVTVGTGVPAGPGWGGQSLVLEASQRLDLACQDSIQVQTSCLTQSSEFRVGLSNTFPFLQ